MSLKERLLMDAISRMDQFRSHATINETHTHILYRGLVKDHFVFQLSCHCLNSTTTMLLSNSFCCMHSVIENWVAVACELCISTNLPVCVCMPRRQTVGVHRTNKTSSKQWMAAAAAETEKKLERSSWILHVDKSIVGIRSALWRGLG